MTLANLMPHYEWCCGKSQVARKRCNDESCQESREEWAATLIADPGPLLAALSEAGVLKIERERQDEIRLAGKVRHIWKRIDEPSKRWARTRSRYLTEWVSGDE